MMGALVAVGLLFALFAAGVRILPEYERGVVLRLGRALSIQFPGSASARTSFHLQWLPVPNLSNLQIHWRAHREHGMLCRGADPPDSEVDQPEWRID